jgi:hypothetical protein
MLLRNSHIILEYSDTPVKLGKIDILTYFQWESKIRIEKNPGCRF